jgi:GxxExxY protein
MDSPDVQSVMEMAIKIMNELGAGYSEFCYRNALYNKLIKLDSTAQKERTIPVNYDGELIGTCRADIVTAQMVIEIKATRTMPTQVGHQIRKYLVNLHQLDNIQRSGMVINFNQDTEQAEFKILDPIPQAVVVYKRRKLTVDEECAPDAQSA